MGKKAFIFTAILFLGFNSFIHAQIGAVIGGNSQFEKPQRNGEEALLTKGLSLKITKGAVSENDKVAAIYRWIATNISYDNELMRSKNLQKKFYTSEENVIKNVLHRKMALCGGFAFLFKKMCADVGIAAEVVHGFTKKYSPAIPQSEKPEHTWNAVKLNGKWQLLDITWAISHGIKHAPDDFWFLTNPSEFILSHYPQNQKWTLLKNPISFSEFRQLTK